MKLFLIILLVACDLLLDDGCWREGLKYIQESKGYELTTVIPQEEKGCSVFTEKNKEVMAMLISECHKKKRSDGILCLHDAVEQNDNFVASFYEENLTICLKKISDFDYNNYIAFYNHIENICFLVHAYLWQTKTESLIFELRKSADNISADLKIAKANNEKLIEQQISALNIQKELLRVSDFISDSLEDNSAKVDETFQVLQQKIIDEHDNIRSILNDIYKIIENISLFQSWLKTKYFNFQSTIMYLLLICITKIMIGSKYHDNCRHKIIFIWIILFFLENFLLTKVENFFSSVFDEKFNKIYRNLILPNQILIFRTKGILYVSYLIGSAYFTYQDENKREFRTINDAINQLNTKLDLLAKNCFALTSDYSHSNRSNENYNYHNHKSLNRLRNHKKYNFKSFYATNID